MQSHHRNYCKVRNQVKGMNKQIDKQLDQYSKINFEKELDHLENDVKNRMIASNTDNYDLIGFMERLFGMPISLSGSALASTLIVGIFIGSQFQPESSLAHSNMSDLEIFSPVNADLPSSLLDPN